MKLQKMMQWLLKLLPKQKMQDNGSGNLQAGRIDGDLHHTHAVYNIFMMAGDGVQAHESTKTAEPDKEQVQAVHARAMPESAEQSSTLRRMGQLRNRITVLNFMEREFGTRMVIHLRPEQLKRLNLYLDAVMRNPQALKSERTAQNRA